MFKLANEKKDKEEKDSSDCSQNDELDFTFTDITIPRSDVTEGGVICPFCKKLQKRVISHVAKVHKSEMGNTSKVFGKKLKKYLHSVRHQSWKDRQDSSEFAEKAKIVKRKSRQKLKEENPRRVRINKRKENVNQRKGKTFRPPFPCARCNKFKCDDLELTQQQKEVMKEKASKALLEVQTRPDQLEEIDDWIQASLEGDPPSAIELDIKKNKEEAETESEAEYGGAWEDESDLEEDIDWPTVNPKWLLLWAWRWKKEQERIQRIIRWNIEYGTREKDVKLKRKLRKSYQYVDWLWLSLQKVLEDWQKRPEDEVVDDEDKDFLNGMFKSLLQVETWSILNRFCATCKKPNLK